MSEIQYFSGIEVILAAIEIEKSGHGFYTEMAERFADQPAEGIFRQLATDEVEHLRTLKELLSSYQDGTFWDGEEEYIPYLRRFHETEVFPAAEQIQAALQWTNPERELLQLAIQAERRFADYFTMAAKHAKTPEGKQTFGWLANEEEQHAGQLLLRQQQIVT